MKGIKLCGECANYDWKKHKCRIGCNDDSDPQASFYGDCPLPDVEPVQSWISVDERLPDENTRVLVYLTHQAYGHTHMDTDRIFDGRWVRWSGSITHWMPLPERPKGE